MENFKNIDEILDFAIEQEQEAVDFYSELSDQAKNQAMKNIYLEFVQEEMGHKQKLMKIKEEKTFTEASSEKITDLKISDYLVPVKPTPDMSYQDALIVVMKKEKAAHKLYTNLSKMAPSEELKKIFKMLAIEEANHKLQFEEDYDEYILRDN